MGRAPCCDKATVKKGPWSPEEDAMLKNYIEEHGTGGNWIALPHKIGLKRCGKSSRLRWLNYLRPNIKHGEFTPEEDSIICSLYISIGSRWSIIAAQLPGRTDNDVKNYWNTKLKKRLLGRRNKDRDAQQQHHGPSAAAANETATETNVMNDGGERALSASAMERIRLCMQLQNNPLTAAAIHNPTLMWPTCRANSFNSNNSANNSNVSLAEQGVQSSSLNEHHLNAHLVESAAMVDGLASPASVENSNVIINIEAELQELLYGEANNQQGRAAGAIDGGVQQQGDMDWWGYDQSKPVNCWDFTPEPNPVFQDYAAVYDI